MKLRVGVVGLGSGWESRHRPALRAMSDRFEVRAICDQIAVRAEQAAKEWNAQAVDGFRSLAQRDDIDAVLVLAPQWYGTLPMVAAAEAGKAIYTACNLELEFDQAKELKRRINESGVAFMAELPRRHSPATIRLKELIATRLGQPRLLFCHTRVPAERSPSASRTTAKISPLNDLVELVDWCRYVSGREPTSVMSIRHRAIDDSGDDYQMMNLDFSDAGTGPGSGPTAQISCGRYMPSQWAEAMAYRTPAALQVACERGIAFIDLPSQLIWFDAAGRHQETLDSERPVGETMLSFFHRSVTSLLHNTASLEDAYRALAVVIQARQSHAENRRVFLEY
ncbi:MAG: Gfo/Idh/MocA family oxidoreductase [Planctomycetaceae bacterium]|nr:Gfo/Idh/MocA family oxidoreductase [Planctomycetaceae bacterium]